MTTLIEAIQESPHIKPVALLERWKNTELETPLTQLMKWQPESDDIEMLGSEFKDCLRQIRKRANASNIEQLLHKERTKGLTEADKQRLLLLLNNRE